MIFLKKEDLRKVQMIQLEMLKEVKRICEEHDIKYFLDSGTLLGAIRHKGFIPWDDDLDVAFIREEYNKFLNVASKELDKRFFLQTWNNDNEYALPFSKIRMNNTKFVENNSKYINAHNGIFIDLLPYDNVPNGIIRSGFSSLTSKFLFRIILMKNNYTPWREEQHLKKYLYKFFKILSKMVSNRKLKNIFNKVITKYNNQNCNKVIICDGAYPKNFINEKYILEEFIQVKFEDEYFSVPKEYNQYLTNVYGDYMTPPPENQRENRHDIIEFRFSNDMENEYE